MADGQRNEKTGAQRLAEIAAADNVGGFRWRKAAGFLFVAVGLYMVATHPDDKGIDWQAWALLVIGGGDLGIQSIGAIAKAYLKK